MANRTILTAILCVALCALASADPAASPATQPMRRPIPPKAELHQAQLAIAEICGPRLRDRSPEVRAQLAQDLLTKAEANPQDAAACYSLLEQARQLAISAADGRTALRATDRVSTLFDADALDLQRATLVQLDAAGCSPTLVAHRSARAAMAAVEQDRPDLALSLARIGIKAAQRSRDPELMAQSADVLRDAELAQQWMQSFVTTTPAVVAASTRAATRPAITPQGRYLLFYHRDLDAAAPAFAASADPLGGLVRREVEVASDLPALLDVANEWWKLSSQPSGVPAWRVRRHAADLYVRCLPALSSLQRDLVRKRLDDARIEQLQREGFAPGITAEIIRASDNQSVARSVEADVILPADDLPTSDYIIRCQGYIDIAAAGNHEFNLIAGTSAKLAIDGRTLVDDPFYYRKRSGERFSLKLEPGLHELLVEIRISGGKPKLELTWRPAGAKQLSPIPTASLYHEAEDR